MMKLIRMLLGLIGGAALLFGLRVSWAGVQILKETGDKAGGMVMTAAGLAVAAAGVFFLKKSLRFKK